MKKSYLQLCLKRNFLFLPNIIIFVMISSVLFGIIGIRAYKTIKSSENNQVIKVGLVGDSSDTYLGIGIDVLKHIDSLKYEIEFINYSENDAKQQLLNKKIACYIIIPNDFIKDMTKGNNTNLTYVTTEDRTYLGASIMRKVASTVSDAVKEAETGIFSMHKISYEAGLDESTVHKNDNELVLEYMNNMLQRDNLFSFTVLGIKDKTSTELYYFCGILFFFLMISGVFFMRILMRNDENVPKYLKSRGINAFKQVVDEYFAYFLILAAIVCILLFSFFCVLDVKSLKINGFENFGMFSGFEFTVKILPVVFAVSSYHFMLYELIGSKCGVILGQFISAVFFSYLGGCFFPIYYFPESYQKIVEYLPFGTILSYLRKTFTYEKVGSNLIVTLFFGGIFLLTSIISRKIKLKCEK